MHLVLEIQEIQSMSISFILIMTPPPKKSHAFNEWKLENWKWVVYWCGILSNIPTNIHVLIPRCCECYLIWDFADVIELKVLRERREGDYPGLFRWGLNAMSF